MAFHPSRVRRPREQVEEQIREAILSGAFRQGDKLPSETQLAEQFSVSRTTVREALRALASAGLISKVAGVAGGSFVRSVDHHALEAVLGDSLRNVLRLGSITGAEVHQMRELLEVPAAGLAAEHRTADDLERLATVLGREKGTTVEDPAVPELDISVHSAVAAASGNRVLGSVVAALHGVARPVTTLRLSPEIGRATVKQHKAVVEAIRAGDREAAMDAMAAHLAYLRSLSDGGRAASNGDGGPAG
jgi:GntR family transcriptional regulator, transcriptional repressor for pyruvate dehydrogenase complex